MRQETAETVEETTKALTHAAPFTPFLAARKYLPRSLRRTAMDARTHAEYTGPMRAPPGLVAALSAVAVLVGGGPADADVCPGPEPGLTVQSIDSQERKDYLARAFDREIQEIDTWSWSWSGVYAAGVIAQGVAIPFTADRGKRIDLDVGTGATGFGLLALSVLPLQLTLPLRAARRHLDDAPACASLARAERALIRVERDQALANGPLAHIGNVAVNLGLALLLGLGYGRWSSGALNGGVGVLVGEANAFTQPHHLRDVLERYRSGRFDLTSPRVVWAVVPVATRELTGAAVRITW